MSLVATPGTVSCGPSFPRFPRPMWIPWKSRLLWTTRTPQPLSLHGDGRPLHTIPPRFTALSHPPVGDVGNRCRLNSIESRFSKPPQIHRRDLENPPTSQPASAQPLQHDFHFSLVTYGYYCLVLYSSFLFPYPSHRHRPPAEFHFHPPPVNPALRNHRQSGPTSRPIPRIDTRNSEICPVFHPHHCPEGEYNQTRTGARPFRTAALCCRVRPS
jgi:hypothetical protein